jgi:hypothetical protein
MSEIETLRAVGSLTSQLSEAVPAQQTEKFKVQNSDKLYCELIKSTT